MSAIGLPELLLLLLLLGFSLWIPWKFYCALVRIGQ